MDDDIEDAAHQIQDGIEGAQFYAVNCLQNMVALNSTGLREIDRITKNSAFHSSKTLRQALWGWIESTENAATFLAKELDETTVRIIRNNPKTPSACEVVLQHAKHTLQTWAVVLEQAHLGDDHVARCRSMIGGLLNLGVVKLQSDVNSECDTALRNIMCVPETVKDTETPKVKSKLRTLRGDALKLYSVLKEAYPQKIGLYALASKSGVDSDHIPSIISRTLRKRGVENDDDGNGYYLKSYPHI